MMKGNCRIYDHKKISPPDTPFVIDKNRFGM